MLLNALVHKDYMGSMIQIRMYDSYFTIWNEGLLPYGLSLEALKRQRPSRPRNPLIADVCFKGGYIDAWGRGTIKILQSCLDAGLPEPQIIEQDGGILVTLFKDNYNEKGLSKLGLNERQMNAIHYLADGNSITNSKYQELFKVSKATSTRDLQELEAKGIIINKGTKGSSAEYKLS